MNYKILTGIRLHDQSEAYRQEWQQFFRSAQTFDHSEWLNFLGQFQRYFTELDDEPLSSFRTGNGADDAC